MSSAGGNMCLDAFIVALSQACEGGDKRWYASTLQLHLASMDFCRACRSIPILHVRIDDGSPRSLWNPGRAQPRPNTRSTKIRTSSRVPVVRALRLTLRLPMKVMQESAATELWTWVEVMELRGSSSAGFLRSIRLPHGLKRLVVDTDVETRVEGVSWPASLKQLSFGEWYNHPISGVVWPASLQQLSFGWIFDHPSPELCGPPLCNSFRSSTLIKTSPESFGRPRCNSYRLGTTSTSPSLELCGLPLCNGFRPGTASNSPSPELCGQPR
ncbi:unnamed protein product [Pylaiella littoralis]